MRVAVKTRDMAHASGQVSVDAEGKSEATRPRLLRAFAADALTSSAANPVGHIL